MEKYSLLTKLAKCSLNMGFEAYSDCISDLLGTVNSGDKFRNICDIETIPPETDFLINNAHFPSFTSPKFPFRRS